MNNILQYSLECDSPNIGDCFFPTASKNYVCLFLDSRYEFYPELFELILPVFRSNGLEIVNLSENKRPLDLASNFFECSIRQIVYLVKNSLLCISHETHFSKLFNECALVSSLNTVEENARTILDKLGFEKKIEVKTQLIGPSYGLNFIEIIPDFNFPANCSMPKNSTIHLRCDLVENWRFAIDLVNNGYTPTICCSEPPPKQIAGFLNRAKKICIFPTRKTTEEQVKVLEDAGLKYSIILNEHDEIIKLNLFNCNDLVVDRCWGKKNLDNLKNLAYDTRIRSTRELLSSKGAFSSIFHWRNNLPIGSLSGDILGDALESEEFLREADIFYYYSKQ